MTEFVTAIVPCFNQGGYLRECLTSLKAQTYPHWRAIIVEDCSTDGATPGQCDAVAEPGRIEVIHLAENYGRALARNVGIRAAEGEALMSLDADDVLAPTHFASTLPRLLTSDHVGIVYTDYERFGSRTQLLRGAPFSRKSMYRRRYVWAGSLYRKSAWEKTEGYRDAFRDGNEDYDLWLSIVEAGFDGVYVPQPLYRQRCHEASWTDSGAGGDDRVYRTRLRLAELHREGFEAEHALGAFLGMTYGDEARRLWATGDTERASVLHSRALGHAPLSLALRWRWLRLQLGGRG